METTYVPIGDPSTDLSQQRRQREWSALLDGHTKDHTSGHSGGPTVDVVVIGGGITGTGIALDAASRGLRTVLVEREDLAFGTSRWSSKLVHGGLRYLATGHADVAWGKRRRTRSLDDDNRPASHSGAAADRSGDDRHVDALGGGDQGRFPRRRPSARRRANPPPTSCPPRTGSLGTRCARSHRASMRSLSAVA